MDQERAEEIGKSVESIVGNMNSIKEEELEELLSQIHHDQGIGPLLKTERVLSEILRFKRTVKGIGNFE